MEARRLVRVRRAASDDPDRHEPAGHGQARRQHCRLVLRERVDRPFPEELPWFSREAERNADLWATADESRADILGLYERAWAHADATIDELPLDAVGTVPWWPAERRQAALHRVLVHMIAETDRHAGHADIIRELIDGAAGMRPDNANMPDEDAAWWASYHARLEGVARQAGGVSASGA